MTSKSNNKQAAAFAFGDPIPVMDRRDIMGYMNVWKNKEFYEPPVSFEGLAKSLRASVYHGSSIDFKVNKLTAHYIPHRLFPRSQFRPWAKDFVVFGNAYTECQKNRLGGLLNIRRSPTKQTRRIDESGEKYLFIKNWADNHKFKPGSVHHLMEPDINQEIYGVPGYLAALHSAWLDESATLFRRKYYLNGSHAGYILYMTDTANDSDDIDALKTALKESKGPGNFQNLFMYAPDGKKDGIQVLPLAEAQAKDEFFNIKRATMRDQLAAHRIPPQLLGIIPENNGGFGDAKTADELVYANEIVPLQEQMMELNDFVGEEIIQFKPYQRLLVEAG